MPPTPASKDVRQQIIEVALQQLADATLEDVFKATTPEGLASGAPWAPSTVRYQFRNPAPAEDGRGSLAFGRRELALAMLQTATADATRDATALAELYRQVAGGRSTDDIVEAVFGAIAENLRVFTPGATDRDVAPRERMLFLALAICDDDADVARLLREARATQIEAFESIYEPFMALLGRRLQPGVTLRDLTSAINATLDGHLARLRYDPGTPSGWVGEAVLAIFAGFTAKIGEEPRTTRQELLG